MPFLPVAGKQNLWFLLVLVLLLGACASSQRREFAERYYNIATDYYQQEDYEQAADYYQLALEQDSNLKIAYLNYGLALIEVDDFKEAERQLLKACSVDTQNTLCLSALGYLRFRAQEYAEAAQWYGKAIAINQYNPQTYYNLGIAQQYAGNYQASQQAFGQIAALQEATDSPKLLLRYQALNQLHLGAEEQALTGYSEYLSENSNDEQVYSDIYQFYTEQEQYDKALTAFQTLEELAEAGDPSPLASFLSAELYYLHLSKPALAAQSLKEAIDRGFQDQERLDGLVKKLRGSNRTAAQKLIAGQGDAKTQTTEDTETEPQKESQTSEKTPIKDGDQTKAKAKEVGPQTAEEKEEAVLPPPPK